jgi:branched-subunit amino acid ABC-type transport system permease component
MNVDLAALLAIQVLYAIASLALISVGLAIIFGMMRVINLAHGEFLMLGGYAAIVATSHGVSIWIAMLVVAPVVVGLIGVVVERTIIRFLYGRMIDTMLATWGLSLFLVGLTTAIFGNTTVGLSAPLGSFEIGAYRTSAYTLFVIAVAIVVLLGVLAALRFTRFGLIARGTMQNADMAAALGVNPARVYAVTFGIGAALSGLAGGVLAPVSGVFPTIGVAYVAKSFITVIGGGAAIVAGTASASALFGTINQIATYATTPVFGGRDRSDSTASPRHHGTVLSEEHLNARVLNFVGLAIVAAVGVAFLILTPRLAELDTVLELTVYIIMAILALSLALVWGYGGILCFGQSAFFGLGAYTYAIAMFNIGESTVPLLLAIAVPAAFAALLGYFIFYGRISDVYLGVITLTVTLILFNSVNSTAGPQFHIGSAKLGGFNGIPGIPPLNIPGDAGTPIDLEGMFYLSTAALLATYFGLRLLLASRFGRIIVGIRENERRAELLGYDPRAFKLATFTIGAALAGFAGCLFANWGAFVSPTIFGLSQSAQIIIWVIVGGRGTLIGPIIGCVAIQWLSALLGENQPTGGGSWTVLLSNAPLVLGAILIGFVLLVPKGLVPTLGDWGQSLLRARAPKPVAGLRPEPAEETR